MNARAMRWLLGLALALGFSTHAHAQVACTVTAVGPAFGLYNPLSAAPTDSNGTVTVTCTLLAGHHTTVTPTIALSAGTSGSYTARAMLAGAATLQYNLFTDPTYTQVWGDGSGATGTMSGSMTLHRKTPTQSITDAIYGQIGALQNAATGSYIDSIVVTVSY